MTVERKDCINQVLTEHLTNTQNYIQLSEDDATEELEAQKNALDEAYEEWGLPNITEEHKTYFVRSFREIILTKPRIPVFYGTWKVHKDKPSVRPVISSCGSYPEIFSIYVDECLTKIARKCLTTYIISSDQLVATLTKTFPTVLPHGCKLFSVDEISMYSNIDADHGVYAVRKFKQLFGKQIKNFDFPMPFVTTCLKLIMKNNIFKFGDTYWKQITGTVMGTSCAVNYAFLYVGLLELQELITDFEMWLIFYGRFIDDGIGIWNTNVKGSARAWNDFTTRWLNSWGRLRWTNTGFQDSIEFLDLRITITAKHQLEFKTYSKSMNLSLYIPPTPAHPPDTIKSLLFGRIRAYYIHNTHHQDFVLECIQLVKHLIQSGWKWNIIAPLFDEAHTKFLAVGKQHLLDTALSKRRNRLITND